MAVQFIPLRLLRAPQYDNRSARALWQGTEEWLDRSRLLPDINASSR